jgi:hypothetical protein
VKQALPGFGCHQFPVFSVITQFPLVCGFYIIARHFVEMQPLLRHFSFSFLQWKSRTCMRGHPNSMVLGLSLWKQFEESMAPTLTVLLAYILRTPLGILTSNGHSCSSIPRQKQDRLSLQTALSGLTHSEFRKKMIQYLPDPHTNA